MSIKFKNKNLIPELEKTKEKCYNFIEEYECSLVNKRLIKYIDLEHECLPVNGQLIKYIDLRDECSPVGRATDKYTNLRYSSIRNNIRVYCAIKSGVSRPLTGNKKRPTQKVVFFYCNLYIFTV